MSASPEHLPNPAEILSRTRTFRDVNIRAISSLLDASRLRTIPASGALIRSGDPYEQKIFVLLRGNMNMRRPTGNIVQLQPGDLIGLANYLDSGPYRSTTLATTEATVLEVPSQRLQELEQTYPSLFNALNRIIARKIRDRRPDRSIDSGVLASPVSSVMKSPVATCGPEISLRDAFMLMKDRAIGSLVVENEAGRLMGILTFAGLAESLLMKDADPADSVVHAACETAHGIAPDTPLWKAQELQQRYSAKYLIVTDADNAVGILSQTDILRSLVSHPSRLSAKAEEANNVKELTELFKQLADLAAEAQETHRRPSSAVRILSEAHLAIQRRVVELTLTRLKDKGFGEPPAGFAVLIMGSGGRKEMLLNPDQDNGLIIGDAESSDKSEVQEWFERFSKRLNKNLDRVGYPICPGDIMARNSMYRKTLARWKKQIDNITKKPTAKAARWCNVVMDFETLYGDDSLTAELRQHVLAAVRSRPRLLGMMVADDAEGKPALGMFNQLITTTKDDQGERIDIKRNGLRIIADAARILALQSGIARQNTTDRLNSLVRVGKLSDDFSATINEAYEELLDLLLTHQINQARHGKKLDKLIDPENLSAPSRSTLRLAMRAVKRLQDQLQDEFGTEIF